MRASTRSWHCLAVVLILAGCGGRQPGDGIIPSPARSDGAAARPDRASGVAEFPVAAKRYAYIASDQAGNEWIGAADPPMLIAMNEPTHLYLDFNLPKHSTEPYALALGRHGNGIWFTEPDSNAIGYMSFSDGTFKEFAIPTADAKPFGITAGPDNAMWFTEFGAGKIGRINLANDHISEYTVPCCEPFQITLGTDGALWFADFERIGRITTSGQVTVWSIGRNESAGITTGPDGAIWFTGVTEEYENFVGRMDLGSHKRSIFAYRGGGNGNVGIVSRESDLWMTEFDGVTIDRFHPATHTLSQRRLPYPYGDALGIALGTDHELWFSNGGAHTAAIGKLCPDLTSRQCATAQ